MPPHIRHRAALLTWLGICRTVQGANEMTPLTWFAICLTRPTGREPKPIWAMIASLSLQLQNPVIVVLSFWTMLRWRRNGYDADCQMRPTNSRGIILISQISRMVSLSSCPALRNMICVEKRRWLRRATLILSVSLPWGRYTIYMDLLSLQKMFVQSKRKTRACTFIAIPYV